MYLHYCNVPKCNLLNLGLIRNYDQAYYTNISLIQKLTGKDLVTDAESLAKVNFLSINT